MGHHSSHKSDVFSFAMTAVQLMTRAPPREENAVGQMKQAISECFSKQGVNSSAVDKVTDILLRCASTMSDQRPTSGEVLQRLSAAVKMFGGDVRGKRAVDMLHFENVVQQLADERWISSFGADQGANTPPPAISWASESAKFSSVSGATTVSSMSSSASPLSNNAMSNTDRDNAVSALSQWMLTACPDIDESDNLHYCNLLYDNKAKTVEKAAKAATNPKLPDWLRKELGIPSLDAITLMEAFESYLLNLSVETTSRQQAVNAEAARLTVIQRQQDEATEAARLTVIQRQQDEAAEAARLTEIQRQQDEAAEAARLTEIQRQQDEAAEAAHLAEMQRQQDEAAEAAHLADEQRPTQSTPSEVVENIILFNGVRYSGCVIAGRGKMTFSNGDVYDGEWKNDTPDGRGKMTFANGDVYEGEWKNDNREGRGIFKYSDGDVYEGEFKNDECDGRGIFKYANGAVYEGEYKNDNMEGRGVYKYADGADYDGEWKNDNREGHGIMKYTSGDVYDGEYKDDVKEGHGILTWKSGQVYEGEWGNDKRDGRGKMTFANCDVYDGEWKNDKFEGLGIFKYADGETYDGDYKNDKREGNGILTYANGNVYDGDWKNNLREGRGILQNANGDVYYDGMWLNDREVDVSKPKDKKKSLKPLFDK